MHDVRSELSIAHGHTDEHLNEQESERTNEQKNSTYHLFTSRADPEEVI